MRVLNLSQGFNPRGTNEEIKFESFTFSGGEPHIKLELPINPMEDAGCIITHRINSFNDLGLLCMAVDALRAGGFEHLECSIPYFPAARQDRRMVSGEPLSVKVYADIINSLDFKKVTIFDPHSDVTPALIKNCNVVNNHNFVEQCVSDIFHNRRHTSNILLVSPDAGANKKIIGVARQASAPPMDVIYCDKKRDTNTGNLTGFKVYADDLHGAPCIIVDDICDGGGTFVGLAKELKKKNVGYLYLVVSHGIFSKGFEELGKYFKHIYTTDSIKQWHIDVDVNDVLGASPNTLTQIELKNII